MAALADFASNELAGRGRGDRRARLGCPLARWLWRRLVAQQRQGKQQEQQQSGHVQFPKQFASRAFAVHARATTEIIAEDMPPLGAQNRDFTLLLQTRNITD
jgi:hypothetical protein